MKYLRIVVGNTGRDIIRTERRRGEIKMKNRIAEVIEEKQLQ